MKKLTVSLLCLLLVFSMIACAAPAAPAAEQSVEPNAPSQPEETPAAAEALFTPGTYTAKAFGNNDYVNVEITVDEDTILSAAVTSHGETKYISDVAIERIPEQIVEHQTLGFDGISGATVTSGALRAAFTDALGQCCTDMNALKTPVPKAEPTNAETTETYDIVIVGAGGAGLAAANAAIGSGVNNIIILEKTDIIGGNTVRSGGLYNCADPVRQPKQGIEDSPEKHYQQTYDGGDQVGEPELIKVMTNNGYETLTWLEGMGLELLDTVEQATGALWPRSHQATSPAGIPFIDVLLENANKGGVKIATQTRAEELLVDAEGRVTGVKAVNAAGDIITFAANKGVILASGGYGVNIEMRMQANPLLDASVPSTNHPGATGDGIVMAQAIGADVTGMDYVQVHPLATPGSGALNGRARRVGGVNSIIVVNKEGERFVNEGERRDVLTAAILKQTDGVVYEINDAQIVEDVNQWGENVETMIEHGRVFKAETLEALADMLGIDVANLVESVNTFNTYVDAQEDPEFGRTLWDKKIETGPFYGVRRSPSVHHTMGGLKINTDAQVLKTDGSAIKSLYAAGEVTGGIHGSNRLGGNAITDIMVFGRIAGTNLAAE